MRLKALVTKLREAPTFADLYVSLRLAQLGVTRVEASSEVARLTPRQRQVAQHAAAGLTNREIAEVLAFSTNAVKKHLKHIFVVLGVWNRTELAVVLARSVARDEFAVGATQVGTTWVAKPRNRVAV